MPNRTQVSIGGVRLADENIQFLSSNQLRIFVPKSQPGEVSIVITNPDGQSSQEVKYVYNNPPEVNSISPGSGTAGTKITLTGKNFIEKILDKSICVTIGGITVDKDKIESVASTKIQFTAPESKQFGAVPVIVINPDGQSSPPAVTFTYNPRPTVRNISPASGGLSGGTKIMIEGTGFVEQIGDKRIQVEFKGISVVPDADVEFVSSEKLRVPTLARPEAGEVKIVVANPDGQQTEGKYTYNPFPTVTSISPPSGKLAGGTKITITGEHFIKEIPDVKENLTITIDGAEAKDTEFISATQLTLITPASAKSGDVAVIVTNPDGQQAQTTFTYNPLPKVTNISPPSGKLSGGTKITITGEHFINEIPGVKEKLTITIDGVEAKDTEFISATQLTVITSASARFGDVAVIVTNPDGQQAQTTFTYNPLPKVTNISPPSGKLSGGTKITITGEHFINEIPGVKEKLTITIDGVEAKDTEFKSATQLTVITPASARSGDVAVIVTNSDGQQAKGTFTYNPLPKVTSISPPSGKLAGGTKITITGESFIQAIPGEGRQLTVTIGGTAATSMSFVSDKELRVTTPARTEPGEVKTIVANPDGQQAEGKYTYNPPLIVTSVSPPSGKLAGGTKITITGEHFINEIPGVKEKLSITIDGVEAKDMEFKSATQLTVITSASARSGDVAVIVTNPDGQQAVGQFTYNPLPTIATISPPSGKLDGGTPISITGDNFIEAIPGVEAKITVTVGGIATEAKFISKKELSVTTPASSNSGTVDVIVTNPDGQQAKTTFTYNPFPKITGISPPSGNPNLITPVTITGENFIERIPGMAPDRIQISIGSVQLADEDIQFLSSNQLRVFAPKSQPGSERIVITNPDEQSSKEDVVYTYNPPPKVTGISPGIGPAGTIITLQGENFIPNISNESLRITIGGISVDEIKSVKSNEIQLIAPKSQQFGPAPVIVINPYGQQSEATVTFTYIPRPVVRRISPSSGRLDGGTKITIEGIGFVEKIGEQRIQVEFEGISVLPDADVGSVSPDKLIVSAPKSESPDKVYVIVTNPDGRSSEKSEDATFTYNPLPKIDSILPESGKLAGGTFLTITGKHFIQVIPGEERELTVTIGGTSATSVWFVSAQELRITTPARPEPGEVTVIVTNPDGQQAKGTYTYNPLPTITGISPPSDKLAGGAQITITGTGFIGQIPGGEANFHVTIGDVAAEGVQFISENQLTAITPERYQPGEVDIIITNPDGQQAKGMFTYNPIPTITSISPTRGKLAGGTDITISGTGFIQEIPGVEAKLTVTIGGIEAPITPISQVAEQMQFISANQLTVTTPKSDKPGEVDVIVTNPDGQQAKGTYIYNPLPTVTDISPGSGKLAGGTKITITGTGFIEQILDKHLNIQFGDVDVTTKIESILPTQIALTTPASAGPKAVDVIITNPDEQQTSTKFTYNPIPTVNSITPDRGTGGTQVTISGSDFIEQILDQFIRLKVGNVSVEKINFVSSKEIIFTAPAYEVGSFPIIVINPDGQESQQVINFTYNPVPTITDISPPRGRMDGGTEVTIRGNGFMCEEIPSLGKIQVKIGDKSVEINRCSPTELNFITPPSSDPGDVDVMVINPDGQEAKGKFTYTSAPIVRSVDPKIGTPEGDTKITIEGENFLEDILGQSIKVTIGGREAKFVSRLSNTEIIARTPQAETPGKPVSVIVIGPDGQRSSDNVKFTYNDYLKISYIFPNIGSPAGDTEVTISGTGFTEEITFNVWFGDTKAKSIQVASPTKLIVRTPSGVSGDVDVKIENDDRQEFTLKKGFQYTDKLIVSKIWPKIGTVVGGTEVVIIGTGFIEKIGEQKLGVTFGGKPGVIISVESTKIIVRTPPGAPDTAVEVVVTGPDGQEVKLVDRFHYIDFPPDVQVYNYPNPTPVGRGTTFRFRDSNGNIEIKIFNMAGELVQSLPGNGGNTISWDGKDRFGNVARFGLYPYVYLVDGVVKQGQLLHIRP